MADANMFSSCPHGGRTLNTLINLVLLVSSILLVGTGAVLMGFYRLHMLDVISVEFLLVPLLLLLSGLFALITALFGFYATPRQAICYRPYEE